MIDPGEAYRIIGRVYKAMAAHEVQESALSTNRPWIVASKAKIKRDAPEHIPSEGDAPETFASRARQRLSNVATIMLAEKARMDTGSKTIKPTPGSNELVARRKAVLSEVDVSPVEVAFLYGYASDKPVRELRIRHGRDEHTGRPLIDSQRPIISNRKRARR